ncbi:hypothetical protein HXZ64_11045 [Acinetobacter indicus]|uniref:hypothetical protein n=1 Tax=Acinetobacter indicus TaxID=756892 RepID=UPI00257907A3|nr:hypothetical protein [Acinetobacter indicus]MDM1281483.1 hypothetical protein [Acinetobacter indicus]
MNIQNHSYPILIFQYASILSLAAPIGVLWILWKMGLDNDIPFLEVLNALIKEAPQSLLYMLIFIIISLSLWNIRLHITESKIYYSVLGIPTLWSIKREDISSSRFNTPESEQQFNFRQGTVQFIFIEKNLGNSLRQRFTLIQLGSFSKNYTDQIVNDLKQHWDLNTKV